MEGRFAKLLARFVMLILLAVAVGNSSIIAYANDTENAELGVDVEESDLAEGEGLGEESEEYEMDDSDSLGLNVCFYIRTNVEDSIIPNEPSDHPTDHYSDGIRIDNAVSNDSVVYDNNITSNLCDDGYTASNDVRNSLKVVPSASQIQSVYPSFNPEYQYVLWYVIKPVGTQYADVNIHVDGVILQKENVAEEEPENPVNPENPNPPEVPENHEVPTVHSDLVFEIFSTNLEPVFEYDGEDHLIGGYIIRVTDVASAETVEYSYGPFGDHRDTKIIGFMATRGGSTGTTFNYKGLSYTVNVDSAYLLVKNPGNYEIPLLFGGEKISAADIIIRDESGRSVEAKTEVKTPSVENTVSPRKITITAGSTVQNDNGSTITNNNVTVTNGSLLPGHRLVTSIVGSQTGPGESVNEITYYDIIDSDGKSYKDMYAVTRENGRLVLVKTNKTSASAGGSTETASQELLAEGDTSSVGVGSSQSTGLGSAAVFGAQRNGDGTTGLLTKNGSSSGSDSASASAGAQDGNSSDESPQVLGARRSSTSDVSMPVEMRIAFIILCLLALMAINIKRSNS